MNAPAENTVICPTCQGEGYRDLIHHSFNVTGRVPRPRKTICLACKKSGRVDASRVCPACHKFTDLCICQNGWRNVEARQMDLEDELNGDKVPGVYRDTRNNLWRAEIVRDGTKYFLGNFKDQQIAIDIVGEARRIPVQDIPELKRQYRDLNKRFGGHAPAAADLPGADEEPAEALEFVATDFPATDSWVGTTVHVDPIAPTRRDTPPDLFTLIQAAQRLDQRACDMQGEATIAANLAMAANNDAVEGWNRVAAVLAELGLRSPAFDRSTLGRLLRANGHE